MWRSGLFCLVVMALTNGECPKGCDQPVAIYKDLQCIPIYEKPTDCCAIKYDCSNIEKRAEGKCTYKGKVYALQETIPKEETYLNCKIACRCQGSDNINCASLDCPEWLGLRPKSGSHFTYNLEECCSTGQKAAPFVTCKVSAEEHKEGERFEGDTRCTECICGKGWKGKYEAPFCMEKGCTEEMQNMPKIKAYCAPSYLGRNSCCPFTWICPAENGKANDNIVSSTNTKGNKEQCKYGSKLLNIGDKFQRIEPIGSYDHFEIECECIIPPFLTCAQKQVFDKDQTPQHVKDAVGLKK